MVDLPISIREWAEFVLPMCSGSDSGSSTQRVLRAVDLAWAIAVHIQKVSAAYPASFVSGERVDPENVLIHCDHDGNVKGVQFKSGQTWEQEVTEVASDSSITTTPANSHAGTGQNSQEMCAALGKILFEVFSFGTEETGIETNIDTPLSQEERAAMDPGCDENEELLTTENRKRRVSSATRTSVSDILVRCGMPQSVCLLVSDLLDARKESHSCDAPNDHITTELVTIREALWDLGCMRSNSESFLFDRTCPKRAEDDTYLFSSSDDPGLYGREEEIQVLFAMRNICADTVRENSNGNHVEKNFHCEMALLEGYSGSGKSRLLQTLVQSCEERQWFVLKGKFDKQIPPHVVMVNVFNAFFGKCAGVNDEAHPSFAKKANRACGKIFSALDSDGFKQLCDLFPNFAKMFPLLSNPSEISGNSNSDGHDQCGTLSMDKVGAATKRLQNLFDIILKSLCSVGHPVLLALDDLHWANSWVVQGLADFVIDYMPGISHREGGGMRGMMVAGTFRSDEVEINGGDLFKTIDSIKRSKVARILVLPIGELPEASVVKLISAKFCLPWRYTRELASVVHKKTRGNPFFVIQLLRSLIQDGMIEYSVKSRRWIWDCDVIDMVMISDGVAELLTSTFSRLPSELMKALKIISCIGFQVDEAAIAALDSRKKVLPFEMMRQLHIAVQMGMMESAGPIYQFTHDIIQQTIYDLIPLSSRKLLHMKIGKELLEMAGESDATHLLAIDQINLFCKDGIPSQEERPMYAQSNCKAAKLAMATSSFDQARSYVNSGIRLLGSGHWETQYSLSLDLFEMSASISCIHGDADSLTTCLEEILSHTRTFDDGLTASSLLAKLLASRSKFDEARCNCLAILSSLGVDIPDDVTHFVAMNELTLMQETLRKITREKITSLLPMTNKAMLTAMKFCNMLCMYSMSKPLLLPLVSCRMIRLTLEYGFCDDSIVGFALAGYSMFVFTEEIQLAWKLGRVSESLVEENPKRHALRSRLCNELTTLKSIKEPWQSVQALLPSLYDSAMLVGDVESAMTCRWAYCISALFEGTQGLASLRVEASLCVKEVAKHQQNTILHSICAISRCISIVSGQVDTCDEAKSFDELNGIAQRTSDQFLVWQVFNCQVFCHFWMREYAAIAELSERHSTTAHPKRLLQYFRVFYEGVAYLNLARNKQDNNSVKWRRLGERAVSTMSQMEETMSKWNFENKSRLMQAELAYLNEDLQLAEQTYKASIQSAREHKFAHEEAMACELFGIFCVENNMFEEGTNQLNTALEKYKQWGAMGKVTKLQLIIDGIDPTNVSTEKLQNLTTQGPTVIPV
jgi:predicted ATPase